MTGRQARTLLLLAALAGVAYWIYKDRPTLSDIVDSITNPIMGSKAAVKTSEQKRMESDATTAITEQVEIPIAALKEGMTQEEVRELLGAPSKTQKERKEGVETTRCTFDRAGRIITFQDNRVVSIVVK